MVDIGSKNIAQLSAEEEKFYNRSLIDIAIARLLKDYLTLAALAVLIILAILGLMAPVIEDVFQVSYTIPSAESRLLPVGSPGHPLGTDNLGRDLMARLLYGARVSLGIGFAAAFFSTFLGVSIGLVAGYYQGGRFGFIDDIIIWLITTLNSIPTLLLLILLTSVFTPSILVLVLVLTLVSWSGTMRLIRGETIARRAEEYVLSARAVGAQPLRIMFLHVLPNTLSILVTSLAIQVGTIILVESALSFLGLGVRPPEPSWGQYAHRSTGLFPSGRTYVHFTGYDDCDYRIEYLSHRGWLTGCT